MSSDIDKIVERLDKLEASMVTKSDLQTEELKSLHHDIAKHRKSSTWRIWKWVVGVLTLLVSWTVGGAVFAILLSNNESMERYSGLIGLLIGVVALLFIINSGSSKEEA